MTIFLIIKKNHVNLDYVAISTVDCGAATFLEQKKRPQKKSFFKETKII